MRYLTSFLLVMNVVFRKGWSYVPAGPIFMNDLLVFLVVALSLRARRVKKRLFFLVAILYALLVVKLTQYSGIIDISFIKMSFFFVYSALVLRAYNGERVLFFSLIFAAVLQIIFGSYFGTTRPYFFGQAFYTNHTFINSALISYGAYLFMVGRFQYGVICLLVGSLGALYDDQRGAILSIILVTSFVILNLRGNRAMIAAAFIVFASSLLFLLPSLMENVLSMVPNSSVADLEEYRSTNTRFFMWLHAVSLVIDQGGVALFFGLDPGTQIVEHAWGVPHNFLVLVFARLGLIGLLAVCSIFVLLLQRAVFVLRSSQTLPFSFFVVAAIMTDCLTQTSLSGPFGAIIFWISVNSFISSLPVSVDYKRK